MGWPLAKLLADPYPSEFVCTMSSEWYTNEDWNDEIEAAFFAKLARARDKAQYLKIQANVLKSSHPKVALMLLERHFSIGEKSFHAQAYEI